MGCIKEFRRKTRSRGEGGVDHDEQSCSKRVGWGHFWNLGSLHLYYMGKKSGEAASSENTPKCMLKKQVSSGGKAVMVAKSLKWANAFRMSLRNCVMVSLRMTIS